MSDYHASLFLPTVSIFYGNAEKNTCLYHIIALTEWQELTHN